MAFPWFPLDDETHLREMETKVKFMHGPVIVLHCGQGQKGRWRNYYYYIIISGEAELIYLYAEDVSSFHLPRQGIPL